ncbi:hypothetical protein VPH35_063050 [Triticum aestivum]
MENYNPPIVHLFAIIKHLGWPLGRLFFLCFLCVDSLGPSHALEPKRHGEPPRGAGECYAELPGCSPTFSPQSTSAALPCCFSARRVAFLHHALAESGARHLLDGMPHGTRASSIVRALRVNACLAADAVAALHCASLNSVAVLDRPVRTSLLTAYARRRGDVRAALALFNEAVHPDVILWNATIDAHTQSCRLGDAVVLFRRMAFVFGAFDSTTLVIMLSGALRARDMDLGIALHAAAVKRRLNTELNPQNALVDMYAKCFGGCVLDDAFRAMIRLAVQADEVTMSCVLSSASRTDNLLSIGESVHGCVVKLGYKDTASCSMVNFLITFYSELGVSSKTLVSWNGMIKGLAENEKVSEAPFVFQEMITGYQPDHATLVTVISGCADQGLLCEGKETHGYIVRKGLLHEESSVGNSLLGLYMKSVHSVTLKYGFVSAVSFVNALMHMYICYGDSLAAFPLLESMLLVQDIISRDKSIFGCLQNGLHSDALEAFRFMHSTLAVNPDSMTLVSVLSASETLKLQSDGTSIHCLVKNALLTMYFRFAHTENAELIFYSPRGRNLCSWNFMISGFAQNNNGWRALLLYQNTENCVPNEISLVGIICASTQLGDIGHGKSIHAHVVKSCLQSNIFVSASVVDMYSKCGRLDIAMRGFESSSIACWNSMISALGFHGHGLQPIELFRDVVQSGMRVTRSTFIALLSACSHSRLTDEGWKYCHLMSEKFGIGADHHVCIVDILGRAGQLEEANEFVESSPSKEAHGVLFALLTACSNKAELKMGESIAKHLLWLEPENSGYYVTISILYACQAMWDGAVRVRDICQE